MWNRLKLTNSTRIFQRDKRKYIRKKKKKEEGIEKEKRKRRMVSTIRQLRYKLSFVSRACNKNKEMFPRERESTKIGVEGKRLKESGKEKNNERKLKSRSIRKICYSRSLTPKHSTVSELQRFSNISKNPFWIRAFWNLESKILR